MKLVETLPPAQEVRGRPDCGRRISRRWKVAIAAVVVLIGTALVVAVIDTRGRRASEYTVALKVNAVDAAARSYSLDLRGSDRSLLPVVEDALQEIWQYQISSSGRDATAAHLSLIYRMLHRASLLDRLGDRVRAAEGQPVIRVEDYGEISTQLLLITDPAGDFFFDSQSNDGEFLREFGGTYHPAADGRHQAAAQLLSFIRDWHEERRRIFTSGS